MKKVIRTELILSELGLYRDVIYHYNDGSSRSVLHSCHCNTEKESTPLSRLMNRFNVSLDEVKSEMNRVEYDIKMVGKELKSSDIGWWEYFECMDTLGRLERLLEDLKSEYEIKTNR